MKIGLLVLVRSMQLTPKVRIEELLGNVPGGQRVIEVPMSNSPTSMPKPLEGVRVLDLSRVLAGPYCTSLLADLGAEVIKVEAPQRGDDTRHLGPFVNGESVYFSILNRNKKSITLNLKDEAAQKIFLDLARKSQVVVENYRPGVAERLGVGYEAVSAVNPSIVYASISGFGQTGPLSGLPAYDMIIQAASGLMSITGEADGEPMKVGDSIADVVAGLFAAFGISTALFGVRVTGRGTHLDVSMLESLMSLEVTAQSQLLATGVAPERVGNRHPVTTPFGVFATKDNLVAIAAANNAVFERVARMIDRPDMITDPLFATDEARTANETVVRLAIEEWTTQRTSSDVVAIGTKLGVPVGEISNLAEAMANPQLIARHAIHSFMNPIAGKVSYVGQPVKFSGFSEAVPESSPELGANTAEILHTLLGVGDEELTALRDRGATA